MYVYIALEIGGSIVKQWTQSNNPRREELNQWFESRFMFAVLSKEMCGSYIPTLSIVKS